jgi:hypothetical protein
LEKKETKTMLNKLINYPVGGQGVVTATEQSVQTDEATLFGTGPNNSDVVLTALATPANLVVTQGGTAANTNYSYVIADASAVGSAPCTAVQTTTGAATLNSTNFNIITFSTVPGHTYNVYRSASSGTPSGTGLIATVTAALASLASPYGQTQAVVDDTGLTASLNVPTVNTTGSLSVPGPIFGTNVACFGFNPQTITNSAVQTWTVAQMVSGMIIRAGNGALLDVPPTAAALVAGLPGVKANSAFKFWLKNTGSGSLSISTAAGVTVTGTAAIISLNIREVAVWFTNVTPGSESVTLEVGPVSAY